MNNGAQSPHRKTVRAVFCGGCNPGYDRVAAVAAVERQLAGDGAFEVIGDGIPDIVVAVCGCTCACIDDKTFGNARIVRITDGAAAQDVLAVLKTAGQ